MKEILMETNKPQIGEGRIVVLGLHDENDKGLISYSVKKAGYDPILCIDTEGIRRMLTELPSIRACFMDLNLERESNKRQTTDLNPAQAVVQVMRGRGYDIPSTFMGISGNQKLIELALEESIPGYHKITDHTLSRARITNFLNRTGVFDLRERPSDPAKLKEYLKAITEGKHYKP